MEITHNNLNSSIAEMGIVVSKGQPFAKRNKERRIRAILRTMWEKQDKPPTTFKNVWFYFKLWIKEKFKRK